MAAPLEKEFDFYLAHQDELVKKYSGKFIVIKNGEVLGAYDTAVQAVTETAKTHKVGSFLVQRCAPGKDNYTAHFQSRVALA